MPISVVICTHNCPPARLARVIDLVLDQDAGEFEVLVVDNASAPPVVETLKIQDPRVRILLEPRPGLTPARLRGFSEARHGVIAFVDDDNFLQPGFLRHADQRMLAEPELGVLGGRSLPVFEAPRPDWLVAMNWAPGCLDAGDAPLTANWRGSRDHERSYPSFAPIGTGMVVRKSVLSAYAIALSSDPRRVALDRRGKSLASGGDNDIVLTALAMGKDISYDPALEILHDIPKGRLTRPYVERYLYETNITWVQVLAAHGISPWRPISRWTLPLRRLRAWIRFGAWRSPSAQLNWIAASGSFEGRARIAEWIDDG